MKQRTMAVTILAALAALAGVVVLIEALYFFGLIGPRPFSFFGAGWLGGILSLVVAFIWFSTAWQLWNLDARGWMFVVVIAIITLVINGVTLLGGNEFNSIWWSFVLPVVALVLAWLPGTRAAFGQR